MPLMMRSMTGTSGGSLNLHMDVEQTVMLALLLVAIAFLYAAIVGNCDGIRLRAWFSTQKNLLAQRKTHQIYKCPTCRQKIRVPKGKGKIEIRCPKCQTRFIKKS